MPKIETPEMYIELEEMKLLAKKIAGYYSRDRLTIEINLDKSLKTTKIKVIEHDL